VRHEVFEERQHPALQHTSREASAQRVNGRVAQSIANHWRFVIIIQNAIEVHFRANHLYSIGPSVTGSSLGCSSHRAAPYHRFVL
jgi:hypothetical protein